MRVTSGSKAKTIPVYPAKRWGTDGWVALNLSDENSRKLIISLEQEILTHLRAQHADWH
ncbi:protein of unknown function [Shewanella benthica]|uniref:Uncharacterized protein n=1 Tax=Shewanella benthica TaxID=43661 RepID=A0A330M3D3_9GAMM|nr:protein of unknown function [Shewanella benthica]